MMQEKLWCSLHKKERSDFLFLRLRGYSKRLHWGRFTLDSSEGIEERAALFRFNCSTPRGALFAEGTQRGSNACPLHLLCKCGVPAYRSRLACRMSFRLRTRPVLAKGSSSILASRRKEVFWYSSLDSRIFSRNFCTITNHVKPKLQVQFDICCRTGLIQSSLTEAKRNRTFASFQRTD